MTLDFLPPFYLQGQLIRPLQIADAVFFIGYRLAVWAHCFRVACSARRLQIPVQDLLLDSRIPSAQLQAHIGSKLLKLNSPAAMPAGTLFPTLLAVVCFSALQGKLPFFSTIAN